MFHNLDIVIPSPFVEAHQFFDNSDKDNKFKIVPYYGQSPSESHQWLELQHCLANASSSVKICQNDICQYAFSAGLDFTNRSIPGYRPKRQEGFQPEIVSDAIKDPFIERLSSWDVTLEMLIDVAEQLESVRFENLNRWLLVQIFQTGSETKVVIKPIHYRNVAYRQKQKSTDMSYSAIIAETWNRSIWEAKDNNVGPPKIYPATRHKKDRMFQWSERTANRGATTVYETVVHAFEGSPYGNYYGGSLIDCIVKQLFAELKYDDLTSKIANSELITKGILLVQQIMREAKKPGKRRRSKGFEMIVKSITDLFQNNGSKESKSMSAIQYPAGTDKPDFLKFDVNRDHDYQDFAMQNIYSTIFGIYGHSKMLAGKIDTPSGLGSNVKLNELACFAGTIDKRRNWSNDFMTYLINGIHEKITGQPAEVGIHFNDAITPMMDRIFSYSNNSSRNGTGE